MLGRITEESVGPLDADAAAERLARLVVPALADWCIVSLGDDDQVAGSRRRLRTAASWHADPAMRETTAAYGQARLNSLEDDAILIRAMRTGQLQLIDAAAGPQVQAMLADGPVQQLMGQLAPEAAAVLPLPGRNGPVGILSLVNGAGRGAFTPEDLVTARHIAARSGLVLDGARLYRQQRGLAEGFQRSLLTAPFEPDHLQVVVRYAPASQAGQNHDQPDGRRLLPAQRARDQQRRSPSRVWRSRTATGTATRCVRPRIQEDGRGDCCTGRCGRGVDPARSAQEPASRDRA